MREVGREEAVAVTSLRFPGWGDRNKFRKDIDGLTKNAKARRGNSLARLVSWRGQTRARNVPALRSRAQITVSILQ